MSWGDAQFDELEAGGFIVARQRRTFSPGVQLAFVYAGVVLPVVCFLMTLHGPIDAPAWQSGAIHDYFAFLLSGRAGYVFFPLLIYSIICFLIALFDLRNLSDTVAVQLGVYSGVLLAFHFSTVLFIVTFQVAAPGIRLLGLPLAIALANLVPIGIWYVLRLAVQGLKFLTEDRALAQAGLFVGVILTFSLILIVASFDSTEAVTGVACLPFGIAIAASLFCCAYWAFGAYLAVAIQLARRNWHRMQFRLSQLLIVFTWLAAYLAACRASVVIALAEYAKLPTSPPSDCYIATAAARGHRGLVGAWGVSLADGRTLWVNEQLLTLKCGELAIRTLCPKLHRALRLIYDRLGPCLAKYMTHPLLADAAYLSLKPCEWATQAALYLLLGEAGSALRSTYADAGHKSLRRAPHAADTSDQFSLRFDDSSLK
jgi:hypothetical protein